MTVATVLPFVPAQWFTSAGDAVLSGGQLWFYEVGTSTPKAVYADYEAVTPLSNPVILNAAGKATVFLGSGGYKVVLRDALGAILDTVDGVFGSGGTAAGGNIQTTVATFADLRALTNPGEVVTVLASGALAQGDGGGGAFTFDPDISTPDDGGVVIAPAFGVGRWVRSVSSIPAISWWGIKGLTTESDEVAIGNAFTYCNAQNCSLIVDRHNVGLRSNATFSGSELIFSGGNFYTAGSPAVLTMSTGARVKADPHDQIIAGGGTLRYGAGQIFSPEWTSPALTDAGLAIAIAAAGVSPCRMEISNPYTCSASVTIPDNIELDFSEDGRLDFIALASLSVGAITYAGRRKIFSWNSIANVGTVSIEAIDIFPEWFGATGNGVTDDSIAFYAAGKAGRVTLAPAGNYLLGPLWSATPTPLEINGGTVTLGTGKTLGAGALSLKDTRIANSSAGWFNGDAFQAVDSEFDAIPNATVTSISGCKVGIVYPLYAGDKPTIFNAHTDILSAQTIGTNASGKFIAGSKILQLKGIGCDQVEDGFIITGNPLTGEAVLSNPLPLAALIGNFNFGASLVILPNMVGQPVTTAPNIFMIFAIGSNNYTVQSFDGSWSTTHNGPMILYWASGQGSWFALKGGA